MPLDRYLPPENLKVEQIIAGSYGHVRIESGVTKYYFPDVTAVLAFTTPEILDQSGDYVGAAVVCQSDFRFDNVNTTISYSDVSNRAGALNFLNGTAILGLAAKRLVINSDINGNVNGDTFVVTAGFTKALHFSVFTRQNNHSSFFSSQIVAIRLDSAFSKVAIGLNSALVQISADADMLSPVATAGFQIITPSTFLTTAGFTGGAPTTITFSVATLSAGSFVVTVPFRATPASGNAPGVLIPFSQSAGPDFKVSEIYKVSVMSAGATVVSSFLSVSNIVTVGAGGFTKTISGVPTTGAYTVRIEEKRPALYSVITGGTTTVSYNLAQAAVCCQGVSTVSVSSTFTLSGLDTSAVTGGGSITGGGEILVSVVTLATAVSALAGEWMIQDLQINLRSRAVASSLTNLRLKPGDNAAIGILFHANNFIYDPGATAVRLSVRGAGNATPYFVYNTNTTIVSVPGLDANYYEMEVLANDEDLLSAQANALLAGSNTSQSLIGEVQWVTTMGTFSSDTFTINAPNEVEREPDV